MSKLVDEKRANELVELSMKEFPDVDKYFYGFVQLIMS